MTDWKKNLDELFDSLRITSVGCGDQITVIDGERA